MDWMTKLGGRKFFLTLVVIGAAMYLEAQPKGLTPTMAGFLATIAGAFSVTNVMSSNMQAKSKGGKADDELHDKVDDLNAKVDKAFDPASQTELTNMLVNIHQRLGDVSETSGLLSKAVVNMDKSVQSLRRG